MTPTRILLSALLALAFVLAPHRAQAQGLTIDIVDGVPSALPITVVPFAFEGSGSPPDTDVASVIRANFNRSGQFRTLPVQDIVEMPVRQADVRYGTWRTLRQDFLLIGRILDADIGTFRVEFELFDVAKQVRVLGTAVTGRQAEMRSVAHQISDMVYEHILGVRGAFWTSIAYVTAVGSGGNITYTLMVADADGHNPRTVVSSREPLMSPAWSPDGRKLAYVSFESGNSAIWIQHLATAQRDLMTSFRGINGAPSFSPDGTRLALTLSRDGNPEIYVMDLSSRQLTRLTTHFAIDTEPVWTPDGRHIIFTSDRAGKPQLYQVPAEGGEATRITFRGEYNARPSIAFDGRRIAMAQGAGNVYRIAVLDRTLGGEGEMHLISPGTLDESPSFAPNGSMILYASREGGRGVLNAVSADGRVRQRLVLADGDVREPAWSPFRQR
ncbi:MAG TPA: Tol-Pal system beta propeller repeat protein TolB [Xanthomonadaceae bacterium]|nr:Tol-Pal system beta propeller repeat protein TolB [Xanthomonadaceae bacterium]